jgi:mono/diheme cytochrome c family protein
MLPWPISGLLRRSSALAVAILGLGPVLLGQAASSGGLKLNTGKEIFLGGCITCHGPDGKGMPKPTLGFEPPSTFPDFTDCNATRREPNRDWKAIIAYGGPARGFSEIMPSFVELLTPEQIDMVVQFLRGFCRETSWPRGELNLPRTLISEKAFPEDETVITTGINAKGAPGTDHKITYERRFGAGNQMEVSFPFSFQHRDTGTWFGGVGDIALGYKRLVFSRLRTGSILSVQGEAILPTGNRARGFGTGVTVFETFASYGQLLPDKRFLQFQSGVELPTDTAKANRAVYWRTAFGKSLNQGMGLGRIRRETIDHPESRAAIEDECSICHMPMARFQAKVAGHEGQVFAHLPFNPEKEGDRLAADGVSCSLCHQITKDKLGTRDSFVGGFVVDTTKPKGERAEYGPYQVDAGHARIMRSSSGGFQPTESEHIRLSEMCGTCHTLYTQALGPQGKVVGELPEQMPYQEWLHSDFKDQQSCQSCHMPVVEDEVPITPVFGEPREGFSRHIFVGGNFFMQRLL